jgi:hypothetical protein
MHGRFAYDENSKIILQVIIVGTYTSFILDIFDKSVSTRRIWNNERYEKHCGQIVFKAVRRPKALGGALSPKRPTADTLKTMLWTNK